jgi:uncharacterized oxidoreductase
LQTSKNTVLITGGGSGIGRGLAESFFDLGNKVIIAGRRQSMLDVTTASYPGMTSVALDIEDSGAICAFAATISKNYPSLNVLINNAGIMRSENLLEQSGDVSDAEATIRTNLLGPIHLTSALLSVLLAQPLATIINVSSGLAFVPRADSPTYCATKAAVHSYTQSLRYQLRNTSVQVIEIIPPYVQTDMAGPTADPRAMPLKDFITETMHILKTSPDANEICVERVKARRFAESNGAYDALFRNFNDALATAADFSEGFPGACRSL